LGTSSLKKSAGAKINILDKLKTRYQKNADDFQKVKQNLQQSFPKKVKEINTFAGTLIKLNYK
jgi:hypothetical protein